MSDSIYLPSIGLALNGLKKSFGYALNSNGHAHGIKNLTNKMREIYHEYF